MQLTFTHHSQYANLWPRLAANFIDEGIFHLVILFTLFPLAQATSLQQFTTIFLTSSLTYWLPLAVIKILYYLIGYTQFGTTLGKILFGITILKDHHQLTLGETILREFNQKRVSQVWGLGYLAALIHPEHQMWHDQFCHTHAHLKDSPLPPPVSYLIAAVMLIAPLIIGYQILMSFINNPYLLPELQQLIQSIQTQFA